MTAFPGFCILAVVRGVPWGDGRRANPTRATARPCVGGASRRFRLRQSGPAGDGRQSQPRGQRPRRTAGEASRRFRLRQSGPAGDGRQSQPHAGDGPGGRRAAVPTPWATAPADGGRRANPTQAAARPCVGGASRRFRLRPPCPAGGGRRPHPRGRGPGGRQSCGTEARRPPAACAGAG